MKKKGLDAYPLHLQGLGLWVQGMKGELGNSAPFDFPRLKDVAEALPQLSAGPLVPVEGDRFFLREIKSSQIIDSMDMIRVGMRIEHGIDSGDFGAKRLLSKIDRRVNEDAFAAGLKPCGGAESTVFGVSRAANRAAASENRYAGGASAPENRQYKHRLYIAPLDRLR